MTCACIGEMSSAATALFSPSPGKSSYPSRTPATRRYLHRGATQRRYTEALHRGDTQRRYKEDVTHDYLLNLIEQCSPKGAIPHPPGAASLPGIPRLARMLWGRAGDAARHPHIATFAVSRRHTSSTKGVASASAIRWADSAERADADAQKQQLSLNPQFGQIVALPPLRSGIASPQTGQGISFAANSGS